VSNPGQKKFFADILRKYGLTETEYRALYRAQGGRCYVCRVATGKSRRLGVDHNRLIAIFTRDALIRAAQMLSDPPPARLVLECMRDGSTHIPSVVGNLPFKCEETES
jgi:hypothetical protein